MNGKPEEIVSILKEEISQYEQKTQVSETGSVVQVGDGIATVYGLENVMYGELLEFENGGARPGHEPGDRQRGLRPAGPGGGH